MAGQKVARGATIDLIVSGGSPQLSYGDGTAIHVINPSTNKVSGTVPMIVPPDIEASWSPDGKDIIYSQNGQLVTDTPNVKNAVPTQLTQQQPGIINKDPSFAPEPSGKLIAFVQRNLTNNTTQLCFATIGTFALSVSCTDTGGWDIGHQINWAPHGQTILVFGSKNNGTTFGIIAFHSNVPFSTQASDWGHGTHQTNISVPQQGVIAGAVAPNGKTMALVAGNGTTGFFLHIVKPDQWNPTPAEQLPIPACQVSWRSDSQALAVIQPITGCSSTAAGGSTAATGELVAVDLAHPRHPTSLALNAAHPAWQPVSSTG